jgi:hypothetical protein
MKIRSSTTNEPWLPKFRSRHSGPKRLEGEESPHFAFAFSPVLRNGNSFPRVDISDLHCAYDNCPVESGFGKFAEETELDRRQRMLACVLFLTFGSEKINYWKRERKSEAVQIWKSPKSGDYHIPTARRLRTFLLCRDTDI